jgi:hypothetical protein
VIGSRPRHGGRTNQAVATVLRSSRLGTRATEPHELGYVSSTKEQLCE